MRGPPEPSGAVGYDAESSTERPQLLDRLSFEDLDARAEAYDRAVASTDHVDRFCSSSFWILPAARCLLAPSARPLVVTGGDSWVALARNVDRDGASSVLHPLEATWGLPSPLIGPDPEAAATLLEGVLSQAPPWRLAILTGLVSGSRLLREVLARTGRAYAVALGPRTRRYVADLSEGVEGFLRRRSTGFRKNLRKAERRAAARGLAFEVHDQSSRVEEDFERILAIERRSWKGRSGVGIDRGPMRALYREMHERLRRRGALRLAFARLDGEDAAYVLGGRFLDTYRGLQFSYDERHQALSLGSLCQLHEIRRLVEDGVERYDLGTEVRYKKRWGERVFTTTSLALRR